MKPRFVIVEGNECTGKTTLVEELRSLLRPQGWDAKDLVHRPGDQYERYLLEYATADRVIFTRSHYAELVFGRLYRGATPFQTQELQALDLVVALRGLVVYCDLTVEEIAARLEARNRTELLSTDDTSAEELAANAVAFAEVFSGRTVIRYEPHSVADLKRVLAEVKSRVVFD